MVVMCDYKLLHAGDTALVVEFGDQIDRQLNDLVLAAAHSLRQRRIGGGIEILPTFRSLMVQFDPLIVRSSKLAEHIARSMENLKTSHVAGRHWCLPVCYDREVAADIEHVATSTNLSVAQVVERHSARSYH